MINLTLQKVIDLFSYQGERADEIQFKSGHDADEQFYIIFDNSDEVDIFVEACGKLTEEDMSDYEVEREFDVELVYSDEYTTCDDCYAVIRTSPDSYGWQPDFYVGDGYIVCNKCFTENEDYQEKYLEERINNPKTANSLLSTEQLEELGFVKINEDSYESGMHNGQNDNPEEIYEEIHHLYYDILFSIDSVGQFEIDFSVWGRKEV